MAQEAPKDLAFSQTARRSLSLVASRPLIFLLIAAPIALTQLAQFAAGPAFLITIFIPIIVNAALVRAVYIRASGGEPAFTTSYRLARDRIGPLLEYALRFFGAVFLLTITVVGIPFAIRTLVRWSLGSQAVLLNNESAKDAISHSCRLVKGLWWQVAGAGLLVFLASGLVGQIAFFVWPRGAPGTIVSAI